MKIGAVIQARLNSKRLPNKVLLPMPQWSKLSIIDRIIENAVKSKKLSNVIVATTNTAKDDELINHLAPYSNVDITRGDEDNVFERYLKATEQFDLDHIVRLTGDNPFIDNNILDDTITHYLTSNLDYLCTKGLPLGMNLEIVSKDALLKCSQQKLTQPDLEHVTHYIKTHESEFKIVELSYEDSSLEGLRLTVDQKEDYIMACILFDYFDMLKLNNSFTSIKNIHTKAPYLFDINKDIVQKRSYKTIEEELEKAHHFLRQNEMFNAAMILQKGSN